MDLVGRVDIVNNMAKADSKDQIQILGKMIKFTLNSIYLKGLNFPKLNKGVGGHPQP